jgi:hypothetical protein
VASARGEDEVLGRDNVHPRCTVSGICGKGEVSAVRQAEEGDGDRGHDGFLARVLGGVTSSKNLLATLIYGIHNIWLQYH